MELPLIQTLNLGPMQIPHVLKRQNGWIIHRTLYNSGEFSEEEYSITHENSGAEIPGLSSWSLPQLRHLVSRLPDVQGCTMEQVREMKNRIFQIISLKNSKESTE